MLMSEPAEETQSQQTPTEQPRLERRFGLLHATALNMANMVGIGPFITIPLLMSAMGGPQAMLGWLVAVAITLPDALIWSELGAALPGSGGSYVYLREGFGARKWGRLMAFLFIWQFIFSGPLEIASGYIGFANYAKYLWQGMTDPQAKLLAAALGVLNIILLYRRIGSVAKITIALWIGTVLTTGVVILSGLSHFDPRVAFDFPPNAFQFSVGFLMGLGAAARIGVYDYLGYYDVCYIGDEVKEPGRVIPRSVIFSLVAVALLYLGINFSIIGVVPWREFVPADAAHPAKDYVVSIMMERIYGSQAAQLFTGMILWTTVASLFALLLGYSRVPYAAALDGGFFPAFGRLHRGGFPALSLLVVGIIAIGCCFLSLQQVIDALLTTRILVQFIGQIGALVLLRRLRPDLPRPYRMWLYPIPCFVALVGWIFLFATSGRDPILFGLGSLAAGVIAFLAWSSFTGRWPFAPKPE
jgi:amino acid transporter